MYISTFFLSFSFVTTDETSIQSTQTDTRISQRKEGDENTYIYSEWESRQNCSFSPCLLRTTRTGRQALSSQTHKIDEGKRNRSVCSLQKSVGECRRRDTPNCSLFEFDRGKVGGNSLFSPFEVVCVVGVGFDGFPSLLTQVLLLRRGRDEYGEKERKLFECSTRAEDEGKIDEITEITNTPETLLTFDSKVLSSETPARLPSLLSDSLSLLVVIESKSVRNVFKRTE